MLGLYLAVPHRGTQRAEVGCTKHSHEDATCFLTHIQDLPHSLAAAFSPICRLGIPAFRVN